MTKPPCKTPDGTDCPRRYIGCRAECDAWHNWLAVHAEECDQERQRKHDEYVADSFSMDQGKRVGNLRRQRFTEKIRKGIKGTMMQAVYAGVFGFITVAVFMGGWVLVFLLLGLLAWVFGGPVDDEDDDGDKDD